MKTIKVLLLAVVSTAMMTACGKKDDNFAAQYAKNKMGATAKDASLVAQAVQSTGIMLDVVSLATISVSPMAFTSTLMLNDISRTVQTTMNGTTISQGTTTMGAYTVQVMAQCANANCNPYYIVATAYQNNQAKIQVGYKFYRLESTAAHDNYQVLDATRILGFADMVNFLNQNGDQAIAN